MIRRGLKRMVFTVDKGHGEFQVHTMPDFLAHLEEHIDAARSALNTNGNPEDLEKFVGNLNAIHNELGQVLPAFNIMREEFRKLKIRRLAEGN